MNCQVIMCVGFRKVQDWSKTEGWLFPCGAPKDLFTVTAKPTTDSRE